MLDLWNYRQRVSDMYRLVRRGNRPAKEVCAQFRAHKDQLFRMHAQSPLTPDQMQTFSGLGYYDYDASYNVWGEVKHATVEAGTEPATIRLEVGADGTCILRQFADVEFTVPSGKGMLAVYWIEGYGGGVFLPFRDATNGEHTYGGGRYLLDTIKGADLGMDGTRIRLDFNYAYFPSCAYNPRWVCPLAPPQNRLGFPIPVGERFARGSRGLT